MKAFVALLFCAMFGNIAVAKSPEISWDKSTLTLIEAGAGYGRMMRLQNGNLLCSYEKRGASYAKTSRDNGRVWSKPVLVARSDFGSAANPEILQPQNGEVLLFYNLRPRDGKHMFSICAARSRDNGASWQQNAAPLYEAGTTFQNGCWEPCARQLPSGEILLFFADEGPFPDSDEQQISLMISRDNGSSWDAPRAWSFRPNHRDGMPVPLVFSDGSVVVAIEDNGLTPDGNFKPAIIFAPPNYDWNSAPIGAESPQRWSAVSHWENNIYAGAPYLIRLKNGLTLLSCQSNEGRTGTPQMVVYIGDKNAKNFASRSVPFDVPITEKGQWNSLFAKDENTVTALTSARLNGTFGLWAIDGKITP